MADEHLDAMRTPVDVRLGVHGWGFVTPSLYMRRFHAIGFNGARLRGLCPPQGIQVFESLSPRGALKWGVYLIPRIELELWLSTSGAPQLRLSVAQRRERATVPWKGPT